MPSPFCAFRFARFFLTLLIPLCMLPAASAEDVSTQRNDVLAAMKRATQFMTDKVAYQGGYVWSYLPDMSRRWGEMEAYPTMIWLQPPGTGTVGHLYLDAYHASGDEFYYRAAQQVADAIMHAQLPSGGWGYLADFAGETSIRKWYDTIGKNGWRLEEFMHYYGNGTFDDEGTSEAAQFLLRMYLEKKDARFKPALDRALKFVLDAQYPMGGWPQRYPVPKEGFTFKGKPDYTGYITLNDGVAAENIKFLLMIWQTLGDARARDAIMRGMDAFLALQQAKPQAGWALQYTLDLKPAGARSYEPTALVTHTSAQVIAKLMDFYELTGNAKFLARIPEAFDWLDSVKVPDDMHQRTGRTHPTFIELGTNKPLFVHRRGSNVINGEYYVDYNPERTITHYGAYRRIDVDALRERYARLKATPAEQASKGSPLFTRGAQLPRYFALAEITTSDLNVGRVGSDAPNADADKVTRLIVALNNEGYWPTLLKATSNPYKGDGASTPAAGDYATTRVGDDSDTSPYVAKTPVSGISTGAFIKNMGELIKYLDATR